MIFDILALLLVCIFFPVIVYSGIKIYKPKSYKGLIIGLSIAFLCMELLRFFYNASLYDGGVTPADDIKYSFITILVIVCMFATFSSGKVRKLSRGLFCLTSLIPVVLAITNSSIYTNVLDTYAVTKALYFLEAGIVLTIALLYVIQDKTEFSPWQILWSIILFVIFVGLDLLVIFFWRTEAIIDTTWYIGMAVSVVTIPLVYGVNVLVNKLIKKKSEQVVNGQAEKELSADAERIEEDMPANSNNNEEELIKQEENIEKEKK